MELLRTVLSKELILLGLRDLRAHKLRSFLTALGMIFGVGAVICMLSIGEGASAEQLENIRFLGSDNIILRSVEPPMSQRSRDENARVQEYGLTRHDCRRLQQLPFVQDMVMMREVADTMLHGARRFDGAVLGTTENFFDVVRVRVARGRPLTQLDQEKAAKVCVIGARVASALFQQEDPLGKVIHVSARATGNVPYTVVGVLADVVSAGRPAKGQGSRDINRDMYIPLTTADARYGDIKLRVAGGTREFKKVEISDVYLRIDSQDNVLPASQVVNRLLSYGHAAADYSVLVPLELLQQAEQNKRLWQTVLGSIAGISLLVGGIGIMNIMLASVTERTREIGIRRALGAKRRHITAQFLVETVILSVLGGVLGIIAGISFAMMVTWLADWETIIPVWGVLLAFGVSAVVGVSFGLYPARRAAALSPIEALRYE